MLRDLRPADRPRERAALLGVSALSTPELLAALLGTGSGGEDALALAARLLRDGPAALARASVPELVARHGLGMARAARLAAAFELARRAGEVDAGTALAT